MLTVRKNDWNVVESHSIYICFLFVVKMVMPLLEKFQARLGC